MIRSILTLLIISTCLGELSAQNSIFGKWKTIDEETGKPKAVVEIYEKDGNAYGRIIDLYRPPHKDQNPTCDECPGDKEGRPIKGMEIIAEMEEDDGIWGEGTILNVKSGKTYRCKMWVENGKLIVRGYLAFFHRTQEWLPYEG
ncbi:MAG: DUF2147 domain-containing protein [Flavobacteriales bacterium]|nr:DUF2147 domain-containing protein [Flavobacteriales bacterium]